MKLGLVIYETFAAARNDVNTLQELAAKFEQLNIVIRAEGNMDDLELMKYGKVFAGKAWTTIHERRQAEGFYGPA